MPDCTYCKGTLEPGSLRAGGAYGAFVSWVPTGREHAFAGLIALGVLSGVTFPGIPLPVLQNLSRVLRTRIESLGTLPGSKGGILSVLRYRGAWSGDAASSSRIRFTT